MFIITVKIYGEVNIMAISQRGAISFGLVHFGGALYRTAGQRHTF
jgi:hypothetical protein